MPKFITATDLRRASQCVHAWALACHGDPSKRREPSAGERLMWEQGLEEERRRVQSLDGLVQVAWDGKDWEAGQRATVDLMRRGAAFIYQGVLISGDLRGHPDLLQRVEGTSTMGAWTYEPVDVKGHKKPDKADRYQVAFYAVLLAPVLGRDPERIRVWTNDGSEHAMKAARIVTSVQDLVRKMRAIRDAKPETLGARCGLCAKCLWSDFCKDGWMKTEDVTLLPGMTGAKAEKARRVGFGTWRSIADAGQEKVAEAMGLPAAAGRDAWLFAQAWKEQKAIVRQAPAPLPPDRDVVYYDIETYEKAVYLHGAIRLRSGRREERQFFAERPEDEAKAWHEFLDWLADDPTRPPIVWEWTSFEEEHARRLWADHGGNAKGWELLSSGLKDLKAWVKSAVALPVSTYSIKQVARVFGFHWDADDAGGLNSQSWYREWLATGDAVLRDKLLRYNVDDVRAMQAVLLGLTGGAP